MPSFRGGQFEGKMPSLGAMEFSSAVGTYLRKVMRPLLRS